MRASHLLAGLALALGLATNAGATIQYNSNNPSTGFDATTAGALPSGWASVSGAWKANTAAPTTTNHTKTFGDTSNTNLDIAVYTGMSAVADMSVKATQQVSVQAGFIGIGVRGNASGSNGYLANCYALSGTVTCSVYKLISGAFTLISSNVAAYTYTGGSTQMNVAVSVVGSTINVTAWPAGSAQPTTPTISVADSSITAAGYPWLLYNTTASTGGGTPTGLTDFVINDQPYGETNSLSLYGPAFSGTSSVSFSGAYQGTAPTGFKYALNGSSSYSSVASPTIGGGAFSFSIPGNSNGSNQLSIQAANNTAETDATTAYFATATGGVTIAPNNAALYYSPCNWNVTSGAATTNNGGAYFKTIFTGGSVSLNFNIANMPTNAYSQIVYRIDGLGWIQANVSAGTVALTMPASTTGLSQHSLEVIVKSTTEFQSPSQTGYRWAITSSPSPAVILTSLTLATGAMVSAPKTYPNSFCIFGDSITEGYKAAMGSGGVSDSDWSDAMVSYSYLLGKALDAEVGIVGFGGQGWGTAGVGNVPAFYQTYNLYYSGSPTRSFAGLTGIIIMQGGNDGASANEVGNMLTVFNGITASNSAVPVFVLCEFTYGYQCTNMQTAIASANAPSQFKYINAYSALGQPTSGVNSFDGVHPQGAANVTYYAPGLAALIAPYVGGSAASSAANIGERGLNVP